MVAAAAPDGYTLLAVSPSHVINPALHAKKTYDPLKDFETITVMANTHQVIVAHPSTPASNLKELIDYAKKNPGKLTYGSAGLGSTSHLTTEYFKLATGTDILHVPYKGVGPMLTDLVSGQIMMGLNGAPAVMPHVNAGRLRALAVSGIRRIEALPQLPTLDESGVKGFDASGWYGVVAPAGTPRAAIERLNAEIRRIVGTPELRARFDAEGASAAPGTPEEFGAFIASEIERWGAVLKKAGIEPQ
jgi:tripartite-type tricarboxylate transporter receptor subunit TctC